MKKIYYLGLMILVLVLGTIIIFKISQDDKNLIFTTFKKSYNYVSEVTEEEEIIIAIDFNKKNSFITQKEAIDSCYISDKNEDNKRQLILNSIKFYQQIKIKDESYYEYKYSFRFNIEASSNEDFIIENAYLIINITDGAPIKLNIGDFNYYKVNKIQNDECLRISKIKAIVNTINERKRVVALNIKIENKTNQELIIKEFKIFNHNINIDSTKILSIEQEINHNSNIKEIISDYNYLNSCNNILDIIITPNENLDLLIPLVYKKDIVSNNFGFGLNYLVDSKINNYIYDDFTYFENISYEDKEIKDLQYYYYESN